MKPGKKYQQTKFERATFKNDVQKGFFVIYPLSPKFQISKIRQKSENQKLKNPASRGPAY